MFKHDIDFVSATGFRNKYDIPAGPQEVIRVAGMKGKILTKSF